MCQTGASDGFFRTARCVNTNEGLAGFWRGNTANLMRVVPNKAVLFASNDLLQSMMRNDDGTLPSYAAIAAGSGAGEWLWKV